MRGRKRLDDDAEEDVAIVMAWRRQDGDRGGMLTSS